MPQDEDAPLNSWIEGLEHVTGDSAREPRCAEHDGVLYHPRSAA
jgi:hypothetical protein